MMCRIKLSHGRAERLRNKVKLWRWTCSSSKPKERFFSPDMREFGPNQVFIYVCLIAHQLLTILSQIKNIQIIYFEVKPVSLRIFSMPWKAWKFQEQCCQSITIQNLQILDSTQFSKLKSKSIKVNNKSSSAKTIDDTAMSPKLSEVVRLWQT